MQVPQSQIQPENEIYEGQNYEAVVPQPNNRKLIIIFGIILILLVVAIGFVALLILNKNASSSLETAQPAAIESANSDVDSVKNQVAEQNTSEENKVTRNILTLEEALAFSLTETGMENVDSARIERITLLYTPDKKEWTFEFVSKINPHKKDTYSETVYDFPMATVKVSNNGTFEIKSRTYLKDNTSLLYDGLPLPSEVALSSYLDIAKQKITGSGKTPGEIISAKYRGFTDVINDWEVNVVLAGEEENDIKKSVEVTFKKGVYSKMSDSTLTIR